MTHRPHDALFKAAFGAPADAAGLFQTVLPADLVAAIRWNTLAREDGSFVDPALADLHSDLLFSARLDATGDEILLYLLIEHQSGVDPDMPLRVLGYEVQIWARHPSKPRPIILPIVLAHAVGGWTEPLAFEALFAPPPAALGIAHMVPSFTLTVVDLAHRTDDEIMQWSLGVFQKLALWLLRDAREAARFESALPRWQRLLAEAHAAALRAQHGMHAFAQLVSYIWHVLGDLRFREFRARLLEHVPEAESTVMTIAEELLEEGRAQGLAKGIEQGIQQGIQQGRVQATQATLRRQLALKFGSLDPAVETRIAEATPEQVERYLERFATRSTLDEIFDD